MDREGLGTIFFDLIVKKYEIYKSPKCAPLGMKCSKSRRLLGLRPRPRWGSLRRSPSPPSRGGFLPSAIAASRLRRLHFPQIFSRSVPPKVIYRFSPLGSGIDEKNIAKVEAGLIKRIIAEMEAGLI